jgi:hypothetical protein
MARNTRNDAAWTYANNPEVFTKSDALALVSTNLDILLGLGEREGGGRRDSGRRGWVAWEGDWTGLGGRVRAIRSEGAGVVHVL